MKRSKEHVSPLSRVVVTFLFGLSLWLAGCIDNDTSPQNMDNSQPEPISHPSPEYHADPEASPEPDIQIEQPDAVRVREAVTPTP